MFIASYFRGRVSFPELLEMDIQFIPTLNRIAYEERKDKNAQNNKQSEAMEDAIMGDI